MSDNNNFLSTEPFFENVAFNENSTVLVWKNAQNLSYASHWHTAMEIIIPIENYYDVSTYTKDFHLLPGDILIIPPGEIHSLYPPKTPCSNDKKSDISTAYNPDFGLRNIYLIEISFLSKIKGFATLQALMSQPLHITPDSYGKVHKNIHKLFLDIEEDFFKNDEYCEMSIYSTLLKIFAELFRNRTDSRELFSSSRSYKKKEYIQKLNAVLDYIDVNYMDNISMDNMAAMAGFSKYHFSRLFSEYTGHTFLSYLNLRRIKAAEALLSKDDLTITEVALQSGFSSIATFNRLFKAFKNCSPSEYRSMNQ